VNAHVRKDIGEFKISFLFPMRKGFSSPICVCARACAFTRKVSPRVHSHASAVAAAATTAVVRRILCVCSRARACTC